MKYKVVNPFITGGYMGSEYFCDRKSETDNLLKAIASGRNVTLISLRRMGKTGLLKHLKNSLEQIPKGSGKKNKAAAVIYTDLMPTMNGNEMLNTISSALLRLKKDEKNFFEKVTGILANLRPKITYDNLTGQPVLELKVESPSDIQSGFNSLLHLLSEIKQELVFIFDEFQQISQYPERNTERMLRTIIQAYPNIHFIFSGSSRHMLESMFSSAERPFYQSAELMYLGKIGELEYTRFIMEKFESGGMKIHDEEIQRIFDWTRLHTYYVQYVCNLLYETGQRIIDLKLINGIFHWILSSHEPLFSTYRNLIPSHQFKLLQAIAVENGISQPTSGSFIRNHKLTSASSVTTSLKALSEKEMIVQTEEKWFVYDVFFSRWLQYQYGNK